MRLIGLMLALAAAFALCDSHGQQRGGSGGSRYGGSPYPGGGGGRGPGARTNAQSAAASAKPQSGSTNQFAKLPVGSGFFFLADTNSSHLWTKVSSGTASNAVTKKIVPVSSVMSVRIQ